jgi:hydrogenase maturation protein HypF
VSREGRRIEVRGTVQGVGFRPWVYRLAREASVTGRVHNDGLGVTIEAFGSDDSLAAFIQRLEAEPPRAATIRELRWTAIPLEPADEFLILQSRADGRRRVSIPADLATCPQCLADVTEPTSRRHRYPFTNCTDCGPRFTIAREIPYDRANTTMAAFAMCAACRREYAAVGDRRFHAQPNACPRCGPRLRLAAADGATIAATDALAHVARMLAAGRIACLKGLGGFHLACDATSETAVRELRRRKRREAKPLAVMVRDLEAAAALAWLDDEERRLLAAVARPIVLVRRRSATVLAEAVAPANPHVGLLLPYSPLHHLLLRDVDRPLVMTSGNLSEEPIAYRDAEAQSRLAGVADVFLLHDREIAARCDDSVARVIAGRPVVLRRARGYVPEPILLARPLARPVLACGGHLKNTFCLVRGARAYLGPHVGDLESLAAVRAFEEAIARMERFLDVRPEIVAYDLHPSYASTAYARARAEPTKVGVQHHHAHVASAMAEHGLRGRVLGIAYDGTGWGTDGTAWGGEILRADYAGFERLASFRPLALAGGDTAIRQVWRLALAALDDAFGAASPLDALLLFRRLPPATIALVRRMIATRLNAPLGRGVGRYYDAVGALVLGRHEARYEGEVASAVELHADPAETGRYAFAVDAGTAPAEVDLRPTIRDLTADLLAGRASATVAARFQNTVIAATVAAVQRVADRTAGLPIVLTGGCFQNARLAAEIGARLAATATVYRHRDVPPGDGGLALGQALVADALVRRGGWGETAPARAPERSPCA